MINILMSRSSALIEDYAVDEISKILNKDLNVLVIAFSHFGILNSDTYFKYYGEMSEYRTKIEDNFLKYDIKEVNWLYYFNMDKNEMISLIKKADVLYFPGGAPDLMYDRIVEKDILEELKSFSGIVIGSSAGAMIQLDTYHISKDNEYHKFSLNTGLSYLNNFFIEVHYRRRLKQKSSLRKMRKLFKKDIYVIPDDGMLIVQNNTIKTLGSARQIYNKKGIIKK